MKMVKVDDDILKRVHETEIEILDEIVRICDKYNLNYYLHWGTLLGAVRHQGFIPWDDDLDICMTRKDYDKFLEVCLTELDDKFYLDVKEYNKKCYLPFAKVRKNNTTFGEKISNNIDNHKGIFVDIFPVDNVVDPNSKSTWLRSAIINQIYEVMYVKFKLKKINDCRKPVFCAILNLFPVSFLWKMESFLVKKDNKKNTDMVCDFNIMVSVKEEAFNRELLKPKKVIFEGKEYMSFNDPEPVLTKLYGDYMKLPPEDQRVNHCPEKIDFEHGKDIKMKDIKKNRC